MRQFFIRTFNKHAGSLKEFEGSLKEDVKARGRIESLTVSENPNNRDLVFHVTCNDEGAAGPELYLYGIAPLSIVEAVMSSNMVRMKSGRVGMAQIFFLSGNRAVGVVVVEKEKASVKTKRAKRESQIDADKHPDASADSGTESSAVD